MKEINHVSVLEFWKIEGEFTKPSHRSEDWTYVEIFVTGAFPITKMRFSRERVLEIDQFVRMLEKAYDAGYERMKKDLRDMLGIKQRD